MSGAFFKLLIETKPSVLVGSTIPRPVALAYIRKEGEKARGSNPISRIAAWFLSLLLLDFLPWLVSVLNYDQDV